MDKLVKLWFIARQVMDKNRVLWTITYQVMVHNQTSYGQK